MSMGADLELIDHLDGLKNKLELHITRNAKNHDPQVWPATFKFPQRRLSVTDA